MEDCLLNHSSIRSLLASRNYKDCTLCEMTVLSAVDETEIIGTGAHWDIACLGTCSGGLSQDFSGSGQNRVNAKTQV